MLITITVFILINNTVCNIAHNNAGDSIVIPSTTIIVEISMINATIPSTMNAGINRQCTHALKWLPFRMMHAEAPTSARS